MRLIIDSDKAKMPRNCHECYLCYGGWCTVMPSEEDEMCPDRDRSEWCPLSVAPDAIPVEWLDDRANDITRAPLFRRYAQQLLDEWQKEQESR